MRTIKLIPLMTAITASLLFTQCSSKTLSPAPTPKTELNPVAPAVPADNPPPAPKDNVDAKSQPENIPAPQMIPEIAPMEEGPIEVGSETIKAPTKEQEEAMRKKVEKSVEKKKKG